MATISKKKSKVSKKLKLTEFSLLAPSAQSVFLAGDFNQWDLSSHPLKGDKNRMWRISLNLNPGQYEYRFFVDSEWQNDPGCPTCVENPFRTLNCVRIVG
ncbi:MAG: isoamylase early set domain-containing protein [Thermodesulfobacteriota bacterium]|jgi:1,4-alpha-glucan branching enzyme